MISIHGSPLVLEACDDWVPQETYVEIAERNGLHEGMRAMPARRR